MFCEKGVLENFAKFTGKHLWQGLLFKRLAQPVNLAKFLRTAFFIEHLQWLLLIMSGPGFFLTRITEYFTQCKTFVLAKRHSVSRQ